MDVIGIFINILAFPFQSNIYSFVDSQLITIIRDAEKFVQGYGVCNEHDERS